MARITVDDCLAAVPNRFELVVLAATRARALSEGARPALPPGRDKNTMVALREIAQGAVSPESLREGIVEAIRRPSGAPPAEVAEAAETEAALAGVVITESGAGDEEE